MVDSESEITVLQLPKFKAEATELIGADGIEALAVYLIDRPKEVRQIAAHLKGAQ